MKINKKIKNVICKTSLLCLGWFIVALLISTMTFLNQVQGNYSLTLSAYNVILFEVICIIPWAISTPFIIWITRSYRFEKEAIHKSFSVHILVIILVFGFHSIIQSYVASIFYEPVFSWSYVQRDLMQFLDMRMLLYSGVVLGVYAVDFQRKNRESKLREPRLKTQLNNARYHALLNQIQPTFLLNSIDDIRKNVNHRPDEAEEILTRFSDLLRIMLQNANKEEVPIREDAQSYCLYLNLLEKRLGIEFKKDVSIEDACYEAMVPAYLVYLMLIMLVEEIIIVGSKSIAEVKRISYSAKRVHSIISLDIKIEGLKLTSSDLDSYLSWTNFGNTRQRLQSKYDHSIDIRIRTIGKAIQMSLQMPFRTEQMDEPSFNEQYKGEHWANELMEN